MLSESSMSSMARVGTTEAVNPRPLLRITEHLMERLASRAIATDPPSPLGHLAGIV